jgi:hypothetical protein
LITSKAELEGVMLTPLFVLQVFSLMAGGAHSADDSLRRLSGIRKAKSVKKYQKVPPALVSLVFPSVQLAVLITLSAAPPPLQFSS